MRRLALLAAMLCAAWPAQGAVVSQKAERITLAVYHLPGAGNRDNGLTQVTESRSIDLPAGESRIQFRNVAATMVPQSVAVAGLPGLRQQNFDFSLLSPGALLQKSLGQHVQLVRSGKGGETRENATLRSGPGGVVLETAGGIQALGCGGVPERLVFDRLPQDLFDVPTLSVDANVPRAGRYRLTLRYLATGLTWAANYVARINPDGRTLSLSGWVTLNNASETGFGRTPVQLIAGEPNLTGEDVPPSLAPTPKAAGCWQTDIDWASHVPAESVRQRLAGLTGNLMGFPAPDDDLETVNSSAGRIGEPFDLGDYKLYTLPEPTTVAARQSKQLLFLNQPRVPFQRVYRVSGGFDADDDQGSEHPATVLLRVSNTRQGGLGKPLPSGWMQVFGSEGHVPVLMGQRRIRNLPAGLPLDIGGSAYDIQGDTMAVSARSVTLAHAKLEGGSYRHARDTIEVTATNHKDIPAAFEWCQGEDQNMRLLAEDRPHVAQDGCWLWQMTLAPGEEARFRYTVEAD